MNRCFSFPQTWCRAGELTSGAGSVCVSLFTILAIFQAAVVCLKMNYRVCVRWIPPESLAGDTAVSSCLVECCVLITTSSITVRLSAPWRQDQPFFFFVLLVCSVALIGWATNVCWFVWVWPDDKACVRYTEVVYRGSNSSASRGTAAVCPGV